MQLFALLTASNDKTTNIGKMKSKVLACSVAFVMLVAFVNCEHVHLPGHGNIERQNLEESVIGHVASTCTHGEKVVFGGNSGNDYFTVNGKVRFSTNVTYYVVAPNGTKEKHTAYVVCNEDRDTIIEWHDL